MSLHHQVKIQYLVRVHGKSISHSAYQGMGSWKAQLSYWVPSISQQGMVKCSLKIFQWYVEMERSGIFVEKVKSKPTQWSFFVVVVVFFLLFSFRWQQYKEAEERQTTKKVWEHSPCQWYRVDMGGGGGLQVRCVMSSKLIKTAYIYIYDGYLPVFLLYIMLVALYDIFCLWSRSVRSLIPECTWL